MNRRILSLAVILTLASTGMARAVAGIPDRVPAATLLVPFFETGIDAATNPHDTLLTVNNYQTAAVRIHWHYWDIDGVATALHGNYLLDGDHTWSVSSRDLLTAGPAAARTALTEGAFYRGFVTIDVVTADTDLDPRQVGYPFGNFNNLEGFIYYTRLAQGSANGLAMVPIEYVPLGAEDHLRGFYRTTDNREEIDADARACTFQLALGLACTGDADNQVFRINQRVFGSTPLSGSSRLVVFTWTAGYTQGPSVICAGLPECGEAYEYRRYNEGGATVVSSTQRLDHVVNLLTVTSPDSGYSAYWNIPSIGENTQIYAFSFNSASPPGNPNQSWDAIFEAFIQP